MLQPEKVILVDEQDKALGAMDKMEAHEKGLLHRAFSVFLFNEQGEMLLQKRAAGKYHSPGLWTNACCSHPREGEDTLAAAHRRLQEELQIDNVSISYCFALTYRSEVGNGLIEHEYDHVYMGNYNEPVHPNPREAETTAYLSMEAIATRLKKQPEAFTVWFQLILPLIKEWRLKQA